jgi:uncharacterized membrane protein YjjP (DUF1212 family)
MKKFLFKPSYSFSSMVLTAICVHHLLEGEWLPASIFFAAAILAMALLDE